MASSIQNFALIVLISLSCTTIVESSIIAIATGVKVMGGIAVGVGAVAVGLPVALTYFGFTTTGVLAGSTAAGIQSAVYGGAATGVFSVCQSVGAAGVAVTTKIVGAALGGALGFFFVVFNTVF